MTGRLCGSRYARNRAITCGKPAGHLASDPFHKFNPDDPDTCEWLDGDSEAPASAPVVVTGGAPGLLTHAEHDVIRRSGELWNAICAAVPEGPTRDADLRELIVHVHAIQHAFMANAAARVYPGTYRSLGSTIAASS